MAKASKEAGSGSKDLVGAKNPLAAARAYLEKKRAKEYKEIRVALTSESLKESLPHIASGCDVVDFLIGGSANQFGVAPCPGFPRGRITQIWGHESAGKSTLALTACAEVARQGGSAVYIDWEHEIVPDYAASIGVPVTDENHFELIQPETLEQGIQFALTYAAAGVDLIVFDSVGAAVPARLANRDALDAAGQGKVGELQSVWSQELPNIKTMISKTGTAVIGISQIRASIGGPPGKGPGTKPQGGNAWKFYSAVRLELRRVANEAASRHNELTHKREDRVIGGMVKVKAVKCKMSSNQGREEIFYIRWGSGIDNIRTVLEIAIAHGVIKKSGTWLSWDGGPKPFRSQGKEQLRKLLDEDEETYLALRAVIRPLLGEGTTEHFVEVDEEEIDDIELLLGGNKPPAEAQAASDEEDDQDEGDLS